MQCVSPLDQRRLAVESANCACSKRDERKCTLAHERVARELLVAKHFNMRMIVMTLSKSLAIVSLALASASFVHAQETAPKAATQAPASKAHVLTRAELDALLAQPNKIVVIDVRRPDEVSSIGGFPVYLSIQLSDLEKSLAWIPKDRQIVTVSNHAGRAGRAADLLSSKGFKVAGAAGVQTYEKEGGQLTKIAVPPAKPADNKSASATP
jgi:rhodanese-related sulfurtransferase